MSEWIRKKDQLPAPGATVIAYYQTRGKKWRVSEAIFDGYGHSKLDKDAWFTDYYDIERLTHWMPLPEPPK